VYIQLLEGGAPLPITREDSDHQFPRWTSAGNSLVYFSPIAAIRMVVHPPYYVQVLLAASLAQAGRTDEAKRMVTESAQPGFDPARFAHRISELCALNSDKEHWLEGFRKAGISV
jgi:hypothetical protein